MIGVGGSFMPPPSDRGSINGSNQKVVVPAAAPSIIVMEKCREMQLKNEFLLKTFPDTPRSETVIQNYRCTFKPNDQTSFSGKMWISQNFVFFTTADLKKTEKIPFTSISYITQNVGKWIFSSNITFQLVTGFALVFTSFYHREETFLLLKYLHSYSPCYYLLPQRNGTAHDSPKRSINPESREARLKRVAEANSRWNAFEEENQRVDKEKELKNYERPDVETAKRMSVLADEVFQNGVQTRSLIEEQAQTIDRVERNVDETDDHLLKGKREIEAIGSVGGQIKKTVLSFTDPTLHVYKAPDRSAGIQEPEAFYNVPILAKHPNCDLQNAVLRFGPKKMLCVAANDDDDGTGVGALIRDYSFPYSDILGVVVRVRPQHVDVRLKEQGKRFRCISSYVQMIVNEIYLRTNKRAKVVFEPGTREFEYGDIYFRKFLLESNQNSTPKSNNGGFQRPALVNTTELLGNNVPKEIHDEQAEQDKIIQDVAYRMSCIEFNAIDIGKEVSRQTEQTKGLSKRLNKTTDDLDSREFETQRLL